MLKRYFQRKFSSYLIKHIFHGFSEKILVVKSPHKVLYRGKPLADNDIDVIAEQAKFYRKSRLWNILRKELLYQIGEQAVLKSKTSEDLIAAKMAVWILEQIEYKLEEISTLR